MMDTLDGDYQAFKANDGAFVRKNFFGRDPRTLEMVSKMSDADIWACAAAATMPAKVYAAFHRANSAKGQPTVLLVKTVKGWGMGKAGEGQEHRAPDQEAQRRRHPLHPRPLQHPHPRRRPAEDPVLQAGRRHAGDEVPARAAQGAGRLPAQAPHEGRRELHRALAGDLQGVLEPTAEGREISTTQAYVRFLTQLLRDKALGPRVVPILVDEARTFGMEGLFRQIGIYNPEGQKYTPVDKDQVMYYKEDKAGQILQEGINEAGGMSSWIAAATSYSTNNRIMVPFYIYYSMFGFQRIGDLAWAAGDMQARGFLLGGTSGRTTLNGEGLQHEDGHSHILAGTIPTASATTRPLRTRSA
jgi:pyruvate dehydrogenase E1 component